VSAILVVVVSLSAFVSESLAQDRDSEVLYTMSFRGTSLREALQQFRDLTQLDISWDPLLIAGKRVACVAENESVEEILTCILNGSGLDFVRRSTGTYVLEIAAEGAPLYGNLRGIVLDGDTEQPLSYAHIRIDGGIRGQAANIDGVFIFPHLLAGSYNLRVTHLGYREHRTTVNIAADENESIEVILESGRPISFTTPIIIDGLLDTDSSTLLGAPRATQEEITGNLAAGNAPLFQSLDAMPGVRVNDATADVHIQGGEAGEHQFRLDGAPVFLPLNVASFIGPFSPFALGKITVHKAGYGAKLGSQISGIIAAEHDLRAPTRIVRSGRANNEFTVQVDPISTNVRHTGFWLNPSGKRVTTLSAIRVGTWSLLAPPALSKLMDNWNTIDTFLLSAFAENNTPFANLPPTGDPSIQFIDVHNALRMQMGLQTLTASSYWGRSSLGNNLANVDLLSDEPRSPLDLGQFKDIYSWQNGMAQIRLNNVRSARIITSFGARGSYYRLSHDFDSPGEATEQTTEDDGNRVFELAVDANVDYFSGGPHEIEAGAVLEITGSRFTVAGTQQFPLYHKSHSWRLSTFVQDILQVGQHAAIEGGTRFTWLAARNTLYAEPRLSARFDWKDTPVGGLSLYLGTGLYRQFVSQFDVSSRSPRTFVSSTRFWMGNDHSVTPPKAAHFAAEMLIVPSAAWSVSVESFYKHQYHILAIDYSAMSDTSRNMDQSEFLESTTGYSYGISTGIKRNIRNGSMSVRFDNTITRRRSEALYRNDLLSVPWSEPFRLELSADLVPLRRAVLLVRWKSTWGRSWGYRKAYYDFLSANLNDVDALLEEMRQNGVSSNAIRRIERQISEYDLTRPDTHELKPIHQLDLSGAYSLSLGKYSVQLRMDIVNVLDRKNTAEWRFELDEAAYYGSGSSTSTGLLDRSDRRLLPRVISFAARLTW